MLNYSSSEAQISCASQFTYQISTNDIDPSEGSISIEINTSGNYDGILSISSGAGNEEVASVKNTTNKSLTFNKLSDKHIYQVLLIFHEEESLCKKKLISGIILNNR